MGTLVLGKVESGVINKGQQVLLMPNRVSSWITQFYHLFLSAIFSLVAFQWVSMSKLGYGGRAQALRLESQKFLPAESWQWYQIADQT